MVVKVRMPRIDANIDEGTVGRWLVGRGDVVASGDPLCEIITDKASFELEAERAGIFRSAVVPEKSVVPVGYVIALVADAEGEPLPDVESENAAVMQAYRESLMSGVRPAVEEEGVVSGASAADTVRATPAARMLARREGISLDDLAQRTDRVIQKADVEGEIERLRGGGT